MHHEISALQTSATCELFPLFSGKSIIGCEWVFAIKVGLDDIID